jgi:hypothetical protein
MNHCRQPNSVPTVVNIRRLLKKWKLFVYYGKGDLSTTYFSWLCSQLGACTINCCQASDAIGLVMTLTGKVESVNVSVTFFDAGKAMTASKIAS